ncbi:MAG: helix-turn-helix domain-containing protein [Vicinamibacterales bacterium]
MSNALFGSQTAATERTVLIDDAAQMLGVCRRTVYYRIRAGRLRTIRTRCGSQRVLMSSLEALLGEQDAVRRRRIEARLAGRRTAA